MEDCQISPPCYISSKSNFAYLFTECISKYSGGCTYYYPSYHAVKAPHLTEMFGTDLRRYLTRKVGFESVMRIRCSKGLW